MLAADHVAAMMHLMVRRWMNLVQVHWLQCCNLSCSTSNVFGLTPSIY